LAKVGEDLPPPPGANGVGSGVGSRVGNGGTVVGCVEGGAIVGDGDCAVGDVVGKTAGLVVGDVVGEIVGLVVGLVVGGLGTSG